jgi:hypothetical protein
MFHILILLILHINKLLDDINAYRLYHLLTSYVIRYLCLYDTTAPSIWPQSDSEICRSEKKN